MLNKVLLIGNVGRDPEIRYTQSGDAVANFSLATTKRWKNQAGAAQEKTEWHSLVAFRQKADFMQQYVKKGTTLFIEGEIQTRDWEKDGVKHYRTEIVVDNIQFAGPPPSQQQRTQQGGTSMKHTTPPGDDY